MKMLPNSRVIGGVLQRSNANVIKDENVNRRARRPHIAVSGYTSNREVGHYPSYRWSEKWAYHGFSVVSVIIRSCDCGGRRHRYCDNFSGGKLMGSDFTEGVELWSNFPSSLLVHTNCCAVAICDAAQNIACGWWHGC